MKYAILTLQLLITLYLLYLLHFLATSDGPAMQSFYAPPLSLRFVDMINLFIHEAGHFFTRPFGMFIYILGGSIMQCLLPLVTLIVVGRQNIAFAPYAGFWLGENFVNVSYYIRDAPYKQLKLIAAGLIHDWNWLLGNNADAAEALGVVVYAIGMIICVASCIAIVWLAFRQLKYSE